MNGSTFTVALTADFYHPDGEPRFSDIGASVLDENPHIARRVFDAHRPVIGAEQIGDANAVVVLTPRVSAETVARAENLLAIGRFGIGYDTVDVAACTAAGVLVFVSVGAVDHSVAEATVAWMLGLTHHVRSKDILVREGRWNDREEFMGSELRGRTMGVIGLGGIARATLELLKPFRMAVPLVYDPLLPAEEISRAGGEPVDLDTLLQRADFVSLHCPLTEDTRGMIGERELRQMKPTAYFLNLARGGIVDEDALYRALAEKRIAGAGIDCFSDEPLTAPHRFAAFDNVLLAPHSIAWTHELFRDIGKVVFQGMVDLSRGKLPRGIVNPPVLNQPLFRAKLAKVEKSFAESAALDENFVRRSG